MKVIITRNLNIRNELVAEECYTDFTDYIRISIITLLKEKYNIDDDIADEMVRNISKVDFIEIVENYLEKLKDDKFERYLEIKKNKNNNELWRKIKKELDS